MTNVLIKSGNLDTETNMHRETLKKTQGDGYVKMKAEINVMCPQAKEYQRLPAIHHKLKEV